MLENRMVIDSEWPDPKFKSVRCHKCGTELLYGNEAYEPDEAYEDDGFIFCEECFVERKKEQHRVCWEN